MNMKKTIYTVIATLLFLISSCTLEQEVYNKINPGMFPQNAECFGQFECLLCVFSVGNF